MQGTRVDRGTAGLPKAGDYGKLDHDRRAWSWYGCTPNGLQANLCGHEVEEHADGAISVSPSILVNGGKYRNPAKPTWHGYLEHGVWREC
jgi:hypothetical protein